MQSYGYNARKDIVAPQETLSLPFPHKYSPAAGSCAEEQKHTTHVDQKVIWIFLDGLLIILIFADENLYDLWFLKL
jgi:hypothetical protein